MNELAFPILDVTVSSVNVTLLVDVVIILPDVINKLDEIFSGTFKVKEPLDVVFIIKFLIVGILAEEPRKVCVPLPSMVTVPEAAALQNVMADEEPTVEMF